jgi:eukaryotic-like serine/threonine-protein kinase
MAFRRRPPEPLPPDGTLPPEEGWPSDEPTAVMRKEGPLPPVGPPPPGPPGEPDRRWWPWLVVLLVAVAIIAGLAAYFATRGDEKKVAVPRVVGLQESAAKQKLDQVGLHSTSTREFSSDPSGIVVAQAPGNGTQVGTDEVVKLSVSKGPSTVTVPNVVSLSEADAVSQLTEAGLKADVVQVPSSQKVGTVVAQNPAFGTDVDPGSAVRLNVSKGRTQTTTVTTTTQTTATAPTQTTTTHVTTTTPTTTTQTTTQTTTTAAQATVPDVAGSTLSRAVSQMRAERLLADSYPVASDESGGTVMAQTPDAGSSLDEGSIVRLNVSTGTERPSVTVPDVTGAGQAAARRRLSRTFTVRTVYRSGETPGIVVGQLPAGGSEAKKWAQVIIYVGR